jgi:hypothetical protein
MKRRLSFLAVPVALVTAVALPAIVLAAHHATYNGEAAGGVNNAGVEFFVRIGNGEVKNVHRFHWFNVPVVTSCPAGAVSGKMRLRMPVNGQEKFHGTGENHPHNATVHVTGEFTHQERRAHGTLRVHNVSSSDCDTGVVDWHAKRGPL